jgi:hypothetical protein
VPAAAQGRGALAGETPTVTPPADAADDSASAPTAPTAPPAADPEGLDGSGAGAPANGSARPGRGEGSSSETAPSRPGPDPLAPPEGRPGDAPGDDSTIPDPEASSDDDVADAPDTPDDATGEAGAPGDDVTDPDAATDSAASDAADSDKAVADAATARRPTPAAAVHLPAAASTSAVPVCEPMTPRSPRDRSRSTGTIGSWSPASVTPPAAVAATAATPAGDRPAPPRPDTPRAPDLPPLPPPAPQGGISVTANPAPSGQVAASDAPLSSLELRGGRVVLDLPGAHALALSSTGRPTDRGPPAASITLILPAHILADAVVRSALTAVPRTARAAGLAVAADTRLLAHRSGPTDPPCRRPVVAPAPPSRRPVVAPAPPCAPASPPSSRIPVAAEVTATAGGAVTTAVAVRGPHPAEAVPGSASTLPATRAVVGSCPVAAHSASAVGSASQGSIAPVGTAVTRAAGVRLEAATPATLIAPSPRRV